MSQNVNFKTISTVVINGVEHPICITLMGNARLEERYKKSLSEIVVESNSQQVIDMLAEAIKAGQRKTNGKLNIPADEIEQREYFANIIDEQPALYGNIIATYNDAIARYFTIQQQADEGNSAAAN